MKFVVTVDTEANYQRTGKDDVSLDNIEYLPRFQELCEKHNHKPTYLVSHEVASDESSVEIIAEWQDRGVAEIGAHLHPWTAPPIDEKKDTDLRFPSELSDEELKNKLRTLTEVIKNNFSVSPTSYRAGRWGIDERQLRIISDLGYVVDSSVTPGINWRDTKGSKEGTGGPDFRMESVYPSVKHGILEVPMTILNTGFIKKENSFFVKYIRGLNTGFYKKILNKIFCQQRWLRVFDTSVLEHWDSIYKSAVKNDLPVVQFMIHSSELMPGGTPYNKTKQDVEKVYEHIEYIFALMRDKKLQSVGLTQFAEEYNG